MSAIEVHHLYKTFEQKGSRVEALKDISLEIESGDIYGIIGMSGAGKSTLVRCLNYLERPTEGSVLINGQDLANLTERQLRAQRSDIAMIFQHFNLLMLEPQMNRQKPLQKLPAPNQLMQQTQKMLTPLRAAPLP